MSSWSLVTACVAVLVVGGACAPSNSKGSGGGDDGDVQVGEECYSGNPTREVAECMRTGAGLEQTQPEAPESDTNYVSRTETCASFRNDLREHLEYYTWHSEADNCWDLCNGGESCADATRALYGCIADSLNCRLEAYGTNCEPTQSHPLV